MGQPRRLIWLTGKSSALFRTVTRQCFTLAIWWNPRAAIFSRRRAISPEPGVRVRVLAHHPNSFRIPRCLKRRITRYVIQFCGDTDQPRAFDAGRYGLRATWGETVVTAESPPSLAVMIVATVAILMGMAGPAFAWQAVWRLGATQNPRLIARLQAGDPRKWTPGQLNRARSHLLKAWLVLLARPVNTCRRNGAVETFIAKQGLMMINVKQLMDTANAAVPRISPAKAQQIIAHDDALVVDVRDAHEVEKTGKVAGSFNVSRGMLEFRADPESPCFDKRFDRSRSIILYCASGGRFGAEREGAQGHGLSAGFQSRRLQGLGRQRCAG